MSRVKRKTRPRLSLVAPQVESEAKVTTIRLPPGWRDGDKLLAITLCSNSLNYLEMYKGDHAISLHTDDVRNGDLGWLVDKTGEGLLGIFRYAPGGYIRLERDDYTLTFKPGTARVMGRVVAVWRDDHFIDLPITIRPLTERK